MKKIAISLLIVLFAIFAFFYVQLQQAKSLLTEQLTKRDIQLETVSISLFPQPVISLNITRFLHKKLKENYLLFHSFLGIQRLTKFKSSKPALLKMH